MVVRRVKRVCAVDVAARWSLQCAAAPRLSKLRGTPGGAEKKTMRSKCEKAKTESACTRTGAYRRNASALGGVALVCWCQGSVSVCWCLIQLTDTKGPRTDTSRPKQTLEDINIKNRPLPTRIRAQSCSVCGALFACLKTLLAVRAGFRCIGKMMQRTPLLMTIMVRTAIISFMMMNAKNGLICPMMTSNSSN